MIVISTELCHCKLRPYSTMCHQMSLMHLWGIQILDRRHTLCVSAHTLCIGLLGEVSMLPDSRRCSPGSESLYDRPLLSISPLFGHRSGPLWRRHLTAVRRRGLAFSGACVPDFRRRLRPDVIRHARLRPSPTPFFFPNSGLLGVQVSEPSVDFFGSEEHKETDREREREGRTAVP